MIKMTREELMVLPLHRLRNLDIQTKDEELMVQEVLNRRIRSNPVKRQINRSDIPDIRTKEEEEKWQKIVDERYAAIKNLEVQEGNIGEPFTITSGTITTLSGVGVVEGTNPSFQVTLTTTTEETTPEPIIEPVVEPATEPMVEPTVEAQAKFCNFCDSKGVRHKKVCTRPQV